MRPAPGAAIAGLAAVLTALCLAPYAAGAAERSLAEWNEVFEGVDACVSPVLQAFEGRLDPPADRVLDGAVPAQGEHTDELLGELGLSSADIEALRAQGVVA